MAGRIVGFLREYILGLSILTIIPGVILIKIEPSNFPLHFIFDPVAEWNAYLLVIGLIIVGIGVYYLYSYLNKRKFVVDELKTDKRSEILKKRSKLETTVKHLPRKYQQMLSEKEEEFNIK
jgi:hypothetical protein